MCNICGQALIFFKIWTISIHVAYKSVLHLVRMSSKVDSIAISFTCFYNRPIGCVKRGLSYYSGLLAKKGEGWDFTL